MYFEQPNAFGFATKWSAVRTLRKTVHPRTCMKYVFPLLLIALTGCAKTHSFDVGIKNNTDHPLTIGFVKSGPPFEPHWAAPEDWAMLPPSRQPARWGQVLAAGKIVEFHVSGKFDRGAGAFL